MTTPNETTTAESERTVNLLRVPDQWVQPTQSIFNPGDLLKDCKGVVHVVITCEPTFTLKPLSEMVENEVRRVSLAKFPKKWLVTNTGDNPGNQHTALLYTGYNSKDCLEFSSQVVHKVGSAELWCRWSTYTSYPDQGASRVRESEWEYAHLEPNTLLVNTPIGFMSYSDWTGTWARIQEIGE